MLLGSGELGKEVAISAKRFGLEVVAVDNYRNAPAMQVSDHFEVVDMLDGKSIKKVVSKHNPDLIVPEVESIRTEQLFKLEKKGYTVIPTAEATHLTMNRDVIRDLANSELKLRTAAFEYAESLDELMQSAEQIGYPCVVKPVMSSSGKGQSIVKSNTQLKSAWEYACNGMRGDKKKVIVEEFIKFDFEITLLTVKQWNKPTLFVDPIGHVQERGDYRESWIPARMKPELLRKAKRMAKKVTDRLGGAGVFGVEFFVTKDDVYFSELSPRPHDTGMVTLISQNLSEFDLHIRAILGFPIPKIEYYKPSASAVILAKKEAKKFKIQNLDQALSSPNTDVRIFGKPVTRINRRMGVALAKGNTTASARRLAKQVASKVKIQYTKQ